MTSDRPDSRLVPHGGAEFATTHWSLVIRARDRRQPDADAALAWLCERYWYPLYVFVRRQGKNAHDAQDLTQAFFTRLLEKNALAAAAPERGRFRSFLLAAMKNFLSNEWDRAKTRKRGGGKVCQALDLESGESRLAQFPSHDVSPERIYEQQWALTLLELVVSKLDAEFVAAGKGRQFDLLKGAITGEPDLPYAAAAAELGLSDGAVRQAASRLRKRYRDLLRAEVSQTVAEPGDVDDEIRSLFEILGS